MIIFDHLGVGRKFLPLASLGHRLEAAQRPFLPEFRAFEHNAAKGKTFERICAIDLPVKHMRKFSKISSPVHCPLLDLFNRITLSI